MSIHIIESGFRFNLPLLNHLVKERLPPHIYCVLELSHISKNTYVMSVRIL